MIEIEFNGERTTIEEGTSLLQLLEKTKIEPRFCAVELNLEILPKTQYESYRIVAGDKIEVVTLVGGG